MTSRTALGRGLGALIPTDSRPIVGNEEVPPEVSSRGSHGAADADRSDGDATGGQLAQVQGLVLRQVPLTRIVPNPRQPREVFDEEALSELAASLAEIGFLQPLVVRPVGTGASDDMRYELVAGERRWRAAAQAGLVDVPVLVRSTPDEEMLRDALLENLHRAQLNALEEAAAYQQLLDDFGCSQEELSTKVGKSRPAISNALRLLRLPSGVQRRVAAGVLSAGHARALAGLEDPDAMERLATRVVAEGLSVRALEETIALGEIEGSPSGTRRRRTNTSPYQPVADDLEDRLETRVRVSGSKRGRLTIEFASAEDLQRIMAALRDPTTWQADSR